VVPVKSIYHKADEGCRLAQSPSRRPWIRSAFPEYDTHPWAMTRKPHRPNYNKDCAYASGFTVLSKGSVVVIPRTSAANDNMSFGRREPNNMDAWLGFEHRVGWSRKLEGLRDLGGTGWGGGGATVT
jgi:hypothetical protein